MTDGQTWRLLIARDWQFASRASWLPSSSDSQALEPGALAKLAFSLRDVGDRWHTETMWVAIQKANRGEYEGELLNAPTHSDSLVLGSSISFSAQHVVDYRKIDETETAAQRLAPPASPVPQGKDSAPAAETVIGTGKGCLIAVSAVVCIGLFVTWLSRDALPPMNSPQPAQPPSAPSQASEQPGQVGSAGQPSSPPPAAAPPQPVPKSQQALCSVLSGAAGQYKALVSQGANEFQLSKVRAMRRAAMMVLLPDGRFTDWLVVVKSLQTTGEGNGVLAVTLPCGSTLATYNNELSDIGSGTLIPQSSGLYEGVSRLTPKQSVRVSGTFLPSSRDGFLESSLTEHGSMTAPELIVRFSEVYPPSQKRSSTSQAGGHGQTGKGRANIVDYCDYGRDLFVRMVDAKLVAGDAEKASRIIDEMSAVLADSRVSALDKARMGACFQEAAERAGVSPGSVGGSSLQ